MIGPGDFADLMTAAGRTPHLQRAACRGEVWMADLNEHADEDLLERAEAVCHRCPARAACTAGVEGVAPHLRPAGYAAGQLLGLPPSPPRVKRDPAEDDRWLAAFLGRRGRVPVAHVIAAADAAGIPETKLRAAKRRLGVLVDASGPTPAWMLPAEAGTVAS